MPVAFDISAEVPRSTLEAFAAAFNRYRDELGNSQKVAIRRGTIALVRGLRARTARSKRQAPLSDVTRSDRPRYLTPKGKGERPVPAWRIRRKGGADERTYIHAAPTRGEARKRYGKYTRWGLAKHSWGWFMHALFHRAELDGGNPDTKVDSRMVDCRPIREIVTGPNRRVEVMIHNKLSYIRQALPPAALAEAMSKAAAYINGQIDHGHARARKELD